MPLADPYRDLQVIDARAPRLNQAAVGLVSLAGLLTGWWPLFAVMALQLLVGLTMGRRWCLPCVFYFEVVQPRLGEGPLEDSRPVRFANQVGAAVLSAAALAGALGWHAAALALGALVAALALLAATTGICVGCLIFKWFAARRGSPLADAVAGFAASVCADCQAIPVRGAPGGSADHPRPVDYGHVRPG